MKRLLGVAVLLAVGVFGWGLDAALGFSPDGSALKVVLMAIGEARDGGSIEVAAYEFTSREVSEALAGAARRGVKVRVVADLKESRSRASRVGWMAQNGAEVRVDGRYPIMHSKVLIIDKVNLETGSFNFTQAASRANSENVLYLRNVPELTGPYEDYWNGLWAESAQVR